ncbi:MAG: hypothetical protein IJE08_01205 [Clostridia bacterium]|nr:hypothetical protein [Clostridia bacterium]
MNQTTKYAAENDGDGNYTVAEFFREYRFECRVTEAKLRFSGDTSFRLYLNREIIATGPISVGGDFLFNEEPRSRHYATEMTVYPDSDELFFYACVTMMPVSINEYSRGRGGFMLEARLKLEDGTTRIITTDKNWQAKHNRAYVKDCCYDQSLDTDSCVCAEEVFNVWHCETAPIKPRIEEIVRPVGKQSFQIGPGETKQFEVEFDKIYAGYVTAEIQTGGGLKIELDCVETDVSGAHYDLRFSGDDVFRGLQLQSIGKYRVVAANSGNAAARIVPYITATSYPVYSCAVTRTSDEDLNLVMDVCRHTLKYCRQMIHLDSPKHSEPLACTGDYYIESLMTAMSFGDMVLAVFDIVRTAELLRMHDGRMFHTTYSLIWVMMLWDVYCITGNRKLLEDCMDALFLLLARFETYIGENGLIETPPDYMFVDWIYIDEISMHHPPKALGQTSLCAFYYGALKTAEKLYLEVGGTADAAVCAAKAAHLREAVNRLLYDEDKGLYFDGLNTPTPEKMLYRYMPQNVGKRYYMPHSNILCACYGICDEETGRRLIRKAVNDTEWGVCQPYFKHFLLQAVDRLDLNDELTLKVLEDWKAPVRECSKGLVEGFIMPEPTYSFDHSHAWGGTPLYSLPKALAGLDIIEPGYRKIALKPSLLGLKSAHVEILTPFGAIVIDMAEGEEIKIDVPAGIVCEK